MCKVNLQIYKKIFSSSRIFIVLLQVMIDRATIERILDAVKIEEVIGDFVSLRRRGANYVACCPFHNEKTPSFSVSPAKGIFKCFGCGKAGSAVTFVMEHEQMSYVEALKYLGNKYGIEVSDVQESEEQVRQRLFSESLAVANEYARNFYCDRLWNSEDGRAIGLGYFKERGFTDQTIKKFSLGYAPNERRAFAERAVKNGYKKEHLVAAGLVIEKENGDLADRFFERVIFPWRSISGKVIAFGGRTLRSDKNIAKYINSPESELFVKNKALYGIFEAKAAIARLKKCYLVEGYTDVISFNQIGIENVVASGGTSLTSGQIALIKRFSNNITVLYDGDAAGIRASVRGIDMLLEAGMEVKVVLLPDGDDPDSFSKKLPPEQVLSFLREHEEDFIAFKYRILADSPEQDPMQKARLINDIVGSIAVIPDAIVRSVYIEETAAKMKVSETLLHQEVARIRQKRSEAAFRESERQARIEKFEQQSSVQEGQTDVYSIGSGCDEAEREILYYLVKYGHLPFNDPAAPEDESTVAGYIMEELQSDDLELQNPLYRRIYEEYFTVKEHDGEKILKYFINNADSDISRTVADLMAQPYSVASSFSKHISKEEDALPVIIPKLIVLYKAKIMGHAAQTLTEELAKAQESGDVQLQQKIVARLNMIMKVRKDLSRIVKRITV